MSLRVEGARLRGGKHGLATLAHQGDRIAQLRVGIKIKCTALKDDAGVEVTRQSLFAAELARVPIRSLLFAVARWNVEILEPYHSRLWLSPNT